MARTKSKYEDQTHNYPEPRIKRSFDKKLSRIGKSNPLGSTLQRVWGCKERHFRLDKMRLKYLTGYALSRTIHRDKNSGLFYSKEGMEELGLARHIIEVWLPPSYFGSEGINGKDAFDITMNSDKSNLDRWEENWNEHRYEFFGAENVSLNVLAQDFSQNKSIKETLENVGAKLVDVLGAFPRNGAYRYFYTIENEDGTYKEPDDNDLQYLEAAYKAGYETKIDLEQEKRDYIYRFEQNKLKLKGDIFDRKEMLEEARKLAQKNPYVFLSDGKSEVKNAITVVQS